MGVEGDQRTAQGREWIRELGQLPPEAQPAIAVREELLETYSVAPRHLWLGDEVIEVSPMVLPSELEISLEAGTWRRPAGEDREQLVVRIRVAPPERVVADVAVGVEEPGAERQARGRESAEMRAGGAEGEAAGPAGLEGGDDARQ